MLLVLWSSSLWIFGIHWVLPYTMPTLLFGWINWFRKHSSAMKHGRGTRGAALASDAAGRGDAPGTLLPARPAVSSRIVPHGFHVFLADSCRRSSDSGRFAQNRVNSGLNQTNRMIHAEIQKRKRCKMHRLTYI